MLKIKKKIKEHDFEDWIDLFLSWSTLIFIIGIICAFLGGLAGSEEAFAISLMIGTLPMFLFFLIIILYFAKMGLKGLIKDTKRMLK